MASANSCTCVLCMFSPRCEPISTRQRLLRMSVRSGDPTSSPKVSVEPDVARAAALGERRRGDVRRAVGLERVLEEVAADAVREERDGLGAVLRLDRLHLLGDVAERLVPRHDGPLVLAAVLAADERGLEAVGVEVRADAAGAARAEAAAAQRVVRVALDLPEPPVPHGGDGAALPEADVAEGRDLAEPRLGGGRARPGAEDVRPGCRRRRRPRRAWLPRSSGTDAGKPRPCLALRRDLGVALGRTRARPRPQLVAIARPASGAYTGRPAPSRRPIGWSGRRESPSHRGPRAAGPICEMQDHREGDSAGDSGRRACERIGRSARASGPRRSSGLPDPSAPLGVPERSRREHRRRQHARPAQPEGRALP